MDLKWHDLTQDEQSKLNQYDLKMVRLLGKRTLSNDCPVVERRIQKLHRSIDKFIEHLERKYSLEK